MRERQKEDINTPSNLPVFRTVRRGRNGAHIFFFMGKTPQNCVRSLLDVGKIRFLCTSTAACRTNCAPRLKRCLVSCPTDRGGKTNVRSMSVQYRVPISERQNSKLTFTCCWRTAWKARRQWRVSAKATGRPSLSSLGPASVCCAITARPFERGHKHKGTRSCSFGRR